MAWRKIMKESFVTKLLILFLCCQLVGLPLAPAVSMAASSPDIQLGSGIAAYESGDYRTAVGLLEEAKASAPQNYAAPLYLGLASLQLNDFDAAVENLDQYLMLNPDGEEADTVRRNLTLIKKEQAKRQARRLASSGVSTQLTEADDKTVVVADLLNTGDLRFTPLSRGLTAMLTYDLAQVDILTVVDRMQTQALIDEMMLRKTDLVKDDKSYAVGQLLQAGKVVPGNFMADEIALDVNTAVIDARKHSTVGSQRVAGEQKQFYQLEKDLAYKILLDLGEDKDKLPAAMKSNVEKIHTKSLPAFTAFSVGVLALDQENYPEAKRNMENAVREDEDFELARLYLAILPLATLSMAEIIASLHATAPSAEAAAAALAGATASEGATAAGSAAGGVSTTAMVVGGVVVVGAAVGVAAAASSSSDDDNGGGITGVCNNVNQAGGDAPETRVIGLGRTAGTFTFSYDMQQVRDRMIVSYEGTTLYDTGCARGSRTVSLSYSGNSSSVTVQVLPNCQGGTGTLWSFTVGCPN